MPARFLDCSRLQSSEGIFTRTPGENGGRLFAEVERLELEGVVGKQADSPYVAGRSRFWVKINTAIGREREAKRMDRR